MQSRFRLTRSEDFKRVRQTGKSYAHPLAVLVALPSASQNLRIGVTAGKTVGTAVQRNRAKRLLREALRPLLPAIAPNWDLILIARPKLAATSLAETREAVIALLNRAKLILSNGS
ncbi:MAG: ribonuclease P protein component [Anaerolineales bacterium]|nr:ribonuclease P protein component [Anaerolineales bacterium]MCZ2122181.1 ribonuclease P protein component [Anaerolineales bacterium]